MRFFLLISVAIVLTSSVYSEPTPEEACNAELGKCTGYCKVGGKDEATCSDICSKDNSICICSTKCQAPDRACIEKCYAAVENYCENNLPVCTGFCMSVEKKEAAKCSADCGKSKDICICQRNCKDDDCRKACLPPLPPV